jgi:hypothetical protein
LELGGLLVAVGGVQSRRRSAAVWSAIKALSASPSIVWHEESSGHFIPTPEREGITHY